MQKEAVLLYPERNGIFRATVPVLRGRVIEARDRAFVQHLARCASERPRPGYEADCIEVAPEAAVEPNPWLDMAGIVADDPTLESMLKEIDAARDRNDESLGVP